MGVFTPVSEVQARDIAAAYDVGSFLRIVGIPAGSVNSNYALETTRGRFFLRVYEEQDKRGARAEAALLAGLAAKGVKTPAPLATRTGAPITSLEGKAAALFPWREGGMRCQASVTAEDTRRLGAELAHVHVAGADLDVGAGRFNVGDLEGYLARIERAQETDLAAQGPRLRAHLAEWTSRRAALPRDARGLVHGDLFRDNVLWTEDGAIAALLDFESASEGVFTYDIMVTVLAWCFGDRFEPALARALVAGYETVRPLTPAEKSGILAEGCLAALRFAITRITDFAMKPAIGPRVLKDWRRFVMRFDTLVALGDEGLRAALGL